MTVSIPYQKYWIVELNMIMLNCPFQNLRCVGCYRVRSFCGDCQDWAAFCKAIIWYYHLLSHLESVCHLLWFVCLKNNILSNTQFSFQNEKINTFLWPNCNYVSYAVNWRHLFKPFRNCQARLLLLIKLMLPFHS